MTPGVEVRSGWDPQELMVWAGPSLCALLLACAEARTHALQQTACAEPERPLFRRMDLWNVRSSMRSPRARNASFDQARRYAVIAGQLFRVATREQQHRHEQGYENEVVAIAHPSHHTDIQLVRSHLVERDLRGMSVRARRSIITA